MDVDLIFKIAAIGILVAVLNQLLIRSGREEQAMMTTLAGLIVVLTMLITQISSTQGPRQPMAAQASGWRWKAASWRQKTVISRLPEMPSPRKIPRAVAYTRRTWL